MLIIFGVVTCKGYQLLSKERVYLFKRYSGHPLIILRFHYFIFRYVIHLLQNHLVLIYLDRCHGKVELCMRFDAFAFSPEKSLSGIPPIKSGKDTAITRLACMLICRSQAQFFSIKKYLSISLFVLKSLCIFTLIHWVISKGRRYYRMAPKWAFSQPSWRDFNVTNGRY